MLLFLIGLRDEISQQLRNNISNVNAQNQYDIYIQQLTESFRHAYVEGAMESLVERFTESHADKEYHYTLYYYDRAGNLVQTVPPKGVKRFDGSDVTLNNHINEKRENLPNADDSNLAPPHDHETIYKYNSLNQLVYQRTPDGGESRFAYDALGRLVVSQNDKQKAKDRFSYTRYDELGRVYEVGELKTPSSGFRINEIGRLVTSSGYEYNVNHPSFPNNWSMYREQVTHTIYDDFKFDLNGTPTPLLITGGLAENQFEDYHFGNTRNRIMAVLYQDFYEPDLNKYNNTTIYNYDVHGNVEELVQVNNDPKLVALDQSVKKLIYTYDLVSGNVYEVIYQKGETDEFRHEYNYDADNRITSVTTSKDGVIKEQDAKYFYYEHGPLARTEVGHDKVQAMDYAYTIQGWIKAVNGEEVDEQSMMGWDGAQSTNAQVSSTVNKHVAKDAFGYSLSYYDNDYKSSNIDFLNHSKGANPNLNAGLYNGNIRSMFTALSNEKEDALATHQTNYTYDQLNRITSMTGYNRIVGESPSSSGFSSRYNFDENGNLLYLHRGAAFKEMDRFEYFYNDPFNNGKNNRLSGLRDHAGESDFDYVDIDKSITSENYRYDEIGQLIQDVDEGIEHIIWTVSNKVKEIQYANGKIISFDYDAMGNRIAKHFKYEDKEISTYYILDAQGNQMAMYTHKKDDPVGSGVKSLYLSERNIYGSSRIGQEKIGEIIASTKPNLININTATQNSIGDKFFELSNHLGNVLEVVSDRKLPVPDGNGNIDYFLADVVSYSDYYPYGMQMPKKNGSTRDYRYGFQGQEMDDEVKGEGNSVNYKYRMHDPRVGRFFAVDPLASKYPHYSTYSFSGNKVIHRVELEGLEDAKFNTTQYDNNRINLSTEEKIAFKKGQTEALVSSAVIAFDILVTKGWLSRSYFLHELGSEMNATDRYHKAKANGDNIGAAQAKEDMEAHGPGTVAGAVGEIFIPYAIAKGSSLVQKIAGRKELASSYMRSNQMKYVDFNKQVYTKTLKKGTELTQFRVRGQEGTIGNYYAPVGTKPGQIGLDPDEVVQTLAVTVEKDTKVLFSTHTKKASYYANESVTVEGGGIQIFSRELKKNVSTSNTPPNQ